MIRDPFNTRLDLVRSKSTHDNALRKLGRDMAKLAARQIRVARIPVLRHGTLFNPHRHQKRLIRREFGLQTGRAWRRWCKAANHAEKGAAA